MALTNAERQRRYINRLKEKAMTPRLDKYLITWRCSDGSEAFGRSPTLAKAEDMAYRLRPLDTVKAIIQNDVDQIEKVILFSAA